MSGYRAWSTRGREMLDSGAEPETVREYEAMVDQQALATLAQRHPEAARPEVLERIAGELAANSQRYFRRIENGESAADVYEDALGRAMMQPPPSADLGGVRPGLDLQQYREHHERRNAAQDIAKNAGELAAARFLGVRVHHPDLDGDPRR